MVTNFLSNFRQHDASQRGFTLIELLVAVAVLAVLLAVGVPSFQSLLASNRLSSQTNDMISALAQARSEAIRRGARVTLCKSSDGTSCTTTGDWEQGWMIFVDTTRSGTTAQVDTGETIIAVHQSTAAGTVLKGSSAVSSYVSYAADGRVKLMSGADQSGTLRVCSATSALTNANRAREIAITKVGRITSSTPSTVPNTCPSP